MRPWAALIAATVLLLVSVPSAAQTGQAPRVSDIRAVLEPPFTYYSVEAVDPELRDITFEWTLSAAGACTDFKSDGSSATWRHDDEQRCPHDADAHPGTITVVVSDGEWAVTRTYAGGSAPHEPPAGFASGGEVFLGGGGTSGTRDRSSFGGNASGDDPRDFPPPTIYGEELECPATSAKGRFEPVQSVWQDEDADKFPDLATKRLVHVSDTESKAELDLVTGKPTQLFGVRGSRGIIHYEATLTGSIRIPAVVRWTIEDAAGTRVLGEIDVGDQWIGGPCGSAKPFTRDFDTTMGLAIRHFVLPKPGAYSITMALAEKGGGPVGGAAVTTRGTAVESAEVRIHFVPVILQGNAGLEAQAVAQQARRLATETSTFTPDYWPLPPGKLATSARPIELDLRAVAAEAQTRCDHLPGVARNYSGCFTQSFQTIVQGRFTGAAWQLGPGAGGAPRPHRIAIVVSDADMDWLYPKGANGFAATTKVFWVRDSIKHWTVAHEFSHTTPRFVWLGEASECTVDYHNDGGTKGHGFQLTSGGAVARIPQPAKLGVMEGGGEDRWIEQCTYWYLMKSFKSLADPQLVAVRGWIAREQGVEVGAFEPGFTFDGVPDVAPGGEGPYAIVLRGAGDATLATYRFDHPFTDDRGEPRSMVSFGMAVARPAGLTRIELTGPSGLLATANATPSTPTVRFTAPTPASPLPGTPLEVTWSASDADGDALTYGLLYSADGGATWLDVLTDLRDPRAEVPREMLGLSDSALLRVVATDGVNSAEATLQLGAASAAPDVEGEGGRGTPGPSLGAVLVALAGLALTRRARR